MKNLCQPQKPQITTWLKRFIPKTSCILCRQSSFTLVCQYCEHDTCFFHHDDGPRNLLLRPEIARHVRHAHYSTLIACGYYEWPLDSLITKLKFGQDLRCAKPLGQWLNNSISNQLAINRPELLLPVPLRPFGYWSRQFNQAQLLAQSIAKASQIDVFYGWAKRVGGQAQHQQNKVQRLINLRNAFEVLRLPPVRSVAIVDDVVTTGCTADVLAGLLRRQYPNLDIQVWALAVTPPRRHR